MDYLSTVSGGGYIGSWLHGVILKSHDGNPVAAQKQLKTGGEPAASNKDPVYFLRKYSNYLAPHTGLFSPDAWTIAGVWLRNMTLNLLILIPFLASVFLLARWLGMFLIRYRTTHAAFQWAWVCALFCTVAFMAWRLSRIVRYEFLPEADEERPGSLTTVLAGDRCTWFAVGTTMLAASIVGVEPVLPASKWGIPALFALFFSLQCFGGFRSRFWDRHSSWPRRGFWSHHKRALFRLRRCGMLALLLGIPLVCALVTFGLMSLVSHWLLSTQLRANLGNLFADSGWWIQVVFGPTLMVLIWMFGVVLQIGLMGADFLDTAREWLTTFGSWLLIVTVVVFGVFLLSVFGPLWVAKLALWKLPVAVTALGSWILSGFASYFAGASSKTNGIGNPPADSSGKNNGAKAALAIRTLPSLEIIAVVAPPIFMVLTLLLISFGTHWVVMKVAHPNCVHTSTEWIAPTSEQPWLTWLEPVRDQYWCVLSPSLVDITSATSAPRLSSEGESSSLTSLQQNFPDLPAETIPFYVTLALCIAGFIVAFLLSWRVNINEFSMHCFYKNRLVRCYLGAGNVKNRKPDRLTGFDPKDDFQISSLRASHPRPYNGPYPIVNCALNLNVGTELATAERKASSFVFTPRACGFKMRPSRVDLERAEAAERAMKESGKVTRVKLGLNGYRNTEEFMAPGGPNLGTAMAISGAAASPNSGYHTSTPTAFLLTVFDVRLGCWVGNPRRPDQSKNLGPNIALGSLLAELFAQTDSRSWYVNLSDGGHFENLGLYELVQRRCRYIIAGDAEEADPGNSPPSQILRHLPDHPPPVSTPGFFPRRAPGVTGRRRSVPGECRGR